MTDTELNQAVARKFGWDEATVAANANDSVQGNFCNSIAGFWKVVDWLNAKVTENNIQSLPSGVRLEQSRKDGTDSWVCQISGTILNPGQNINDGMGQDSKAARAGCLAFLSLASS